MWQYKLRAEADIDLINFIRLIPSEVSNINFDYSRSPKGLFIGVVMSFQSNLLPSNLREVMNQVPDSHVMKETLALATEYTGERI